MALQAGKYMARNRKKQHKPRPQRRQLKAKTEGQVEYIEAISQNDVTFCDGPAGTGKTAVAVGLACQYLIDKEIDKIVITRPVVESGKGLGYLPGSFTEKIHPYLVPVLEEMNAYLTPDSVNTYRSSNTIEICPLEYMRGRNFHNAFMILDEAQNATYEQIKMFVTRIGRNSKAVVNGDVEQTDLPLSQSGALDRCFDKLEDTEGVGLVQLGPEDIIRNDIIHRILSRLDR